MDEQAELTSPARKWGRRLLLIVGVLALLVVVTFFVVSSNAFFKGVILPKAAAALNADIDVADASVHPFSGVVLRQLKVTPKGAETLLTVQEARVRYELMPMLGGKISLGELALVAPTLEIIEHTNGRSNLDVLLSGLTNKASSGRSTPASDKGGPPELAVRNVSLTDGTVRQVKLGSDGSRQTTELSGLTIGLDRLENGQSGKFTLAAAVRMETILPPGRTNGSNSSLSAKVSGGYDFALDPKLAPQTVKGTTRFEVTKADGTSGDLQGLGANLSADLSTKELRELMLKFDKTNKELGRVRVSGPLDLQQQEGRLNVEISSIDRQVLNLLGTGRGLDFGQSALNGKTTVDISQRGGVIAAEGNLKGTQLGIRKGNQTTPPLDVEVNYQFSVDIGEKSGLLRSFKIQAKDGQVDVLRAALDRPMTLNWGGIAPGFKESALHLTVTNLNLSNWGIFVGQSVPTGRVGLDLNVTAQKDGQFLVFDLASQIEDLTVKWSTNKLEQAQLQTQVKGEVERFKKASISSYQVELQQRKRMLVTSKGAANYDSDTQDLGVQTTVEAALPTLLQQFPVPQLQAGAGAVKYSGLYTKKGERQESAGNLALTDFTGTYGAYSFRNYQASWDYRVEIKDLVAQVHRAALTIREGFEPGGNFDINGSYDIPRKTGTFTFKSVDLNEHALRPFLSPSLGNKTLVSISINTEGSVRYDAAGESSIKNDLTIKNLVVKDLENKFPTAPLGAGFQIDAALRQKTLDLHHLGLVLTPTARATNRLDAHGLLDFGQTNPAPSKLSIKADSLDLTPYYDILEGKPKTNAVTVTAGKTAPNAPARSSGEPPPVDLPFQQFTLDSQIGRLFVREVAITNWQTSLKIDHGQVDLKPFKLTMNGSPVDASALLDLRVPGYRYDVALNVDRVPLEPLVNSFQPQRKGQVGGTVTAQANIKGAGVTGSSLQKNLVGQLNLSSTNLNLSLANVQDPRLKSLINTIVALPELLGNPAGAIGNLLGTLTGTPTQKGGWIDDLKKSPIDTLVAQASAGKGLVQLQQALVQSSAFKAEAKGTVTLAPELTNSALNIPVSIYLSRPMADKIGMVSPETPTNAPYVKLPEFYTEVGTLGVPKPEINKAALLAVGLKASGGILGKTGGALGGNTGDVLGTLGGILSPGKTPPAGGAATNKPTAGSATNKPPAPPQPQPSILDLFKKPSQEPNTKPK